MGKCIICGTVVAKGATKCPRCGCNVIITATNKFHNQKIKTADGNFDSKLEYEYWQYLKLLEKAKQITGLKRQVKFVLIDKSKYGKEISYIADFVYADKTGERVVADTKSKATKTNVYRLKKRLMAERYGIVIKEITKKDLR